MWKIRKKYKHNTSNKTIYEVTYVNESGALIKYNYGDKEFYSFITNEEFQYYSEYKEPVVHKRWVHFYRNNNYGVTTWTTETPEKPKGITLKYIECKEVSITEGAEV